MLKTIAAAVLASALALSAFTQRAQSAEAATLDDTAKFLAGIRPSAGSPLASYASDGGWQAHAHHFDSIFGAYDKRQLARIRAWSKATLSTHENNVFYMFSGPDFLYANAFYPDATTYVLAALEPVGQVPELTKLPRGAVESALRNTEISMQSLLTLSFFITKNMHTQLRTGPVNGTLPVIYVFLARSGKTVREMSYVNIDDQGAEQPSSATDTKSPTHGVKIAFSDADGRMQTLYYFSTNVSDEGVKGGGFLKFLTQLGPADGFIKSASYLPPRPYFSVVRNFLLDHTTTMIQDDTGIPVKDFDPTKWKLRPFGRYAGPISVFSQYYQKQMADLFKRERAPAIDFGIGYRYRSNESSLLLAQKIEQKAN